MKAISLTQPWADLILAGVKTIETRMWSTQYRGNLLICASKKFQTDFSDEVAECIKRSCIAKGYQPKERNETPQGVAICVVNLLHVRDMQNDEFDPLMACYPFEHGRKAWLITEVRPVKQVPIKGKLSLFEIDDSLIEYL